MNVHVVLVDLFLDEALVANLADVRHLRVLKRENKCKISPEPLLECYKHGIKLLEVKINTVKHSKVAQTTHL